MNATRAKLVADVAVSKPCHSTSGPIVAKNVDSSWIEMRIVLTTSLRGSLPGSGHTRAIPCGVRMFSPQRICLTTFKKAGREQHEPGSDPLSNRDHHQTVRCTRPLNFDHHRSRERLECECAWRQWNELWPVSVAYRWPGR